MGGRPRPSGAPWRRELTAIQLFVAADPAAAQPVAVRGHDELVPTMPMPTSVEPTPRLSISGKIKVGAVWNTAKRHLGDLLHCAHRHRMQHVVVDAVEDAGGQTRHGATQRALPTRRTQGLALLPSARSESADPAILARKRVQALPRQGDSAAWTAFAGRGGRQRQAGARSPSRTSAWIGLRCFVRLVGARGFEPPTPASRTQYSTRLSYAPR